MKTINFFDIDETMFFTKTKVKVVDKETKKFIKYLDNSQFIFDELNENEEYDFSDFVSSDLFIENSTPNKAIIDTLIDSFNRKEEVHIITARSSLDSKEKLLDYMKSFNIPVGHKNNGLVHIYRVGDYQGPTETKKKKLIRKLVKQKSYKKVRFYDDAEPNLDKFKELSSELPGVVLKAYKVIKEKYYLY